MNILVIDDECPSPYSGKGIRVINICKLLSKAHKLFFVYFDLFYNHVPDNNSLKDCFVNIGALKVPFVKTFHGRIINFISMKPGEYVRFSNKPILDYLTKKLNEYIAGNGIDLIHNFSFHAAQYIMDLNTPKIFDIGDAYSLNIKRESNNKQWFSKIKHRIYAKKMFNYEDEMIGDSSKTIFVSPVDAAVHKKQYSKIEIIPNGVDIDYFSPINLPEEYPSVIFTGHMNYEPNIDAAIFFYSEILPRLVGEFADIKFIIAGADPVNKIIKLSSCPNVVVTGKVDDLRPYLAKASLVVAPMRSGSGIKNKVLQAMSLGKTVVTNELGIEAINLENDKDVVLAEGAGDFANKISGLLRNKIQRDAIGESAREKIVNNYSWNAAIERYRQIYKEVSLG